MTIIGLEYKKVVRIIWKEPAIWHSLEFVRKGIIFLVGSSVVIVGIALIFLPGPAFVVIPLGLSILGAEFIWARRILRYARKSAGQTASRCWRGIKKNKQPKDT